MAKRRKRAATEPQPKAVTETTSSPLNEKVASEFEERKRAFSNQEVERRIAAIRAIEAAEVQSLLSHLRLTRLCFTTEQLQTPALKYFQENMPNYYPIVDEKSKIIEFKCKDEEGNGGNLRASLNLPLSVASVEKGFFRAANLQIPDTVLDGPSENQMPTASNTFQTPGAMCSRLSVGMTPGTSRQPKNGEILLSVRGTPLGVYKEDNLEAIHEFGDGSHEGAS